MPIGIASKWAPSRSLLNSLGQKQGVFGFITTFAREGINCFIMAFNVNSVLSGILSTRSYRKDTFYHLIYEWEDDLADYLETPILNATPYYRKLIINRIIRKLATLVGGGMWRKLNNFIETTNIIRPLNGYYFAFEIGVKDFPDFSTSKRAIPAFIDLWKPIDLVSLEDIYKECPLVLISSLETMEYLQEHKCKLNLGHLPLSLSDRYQAKPGVLYEKKYDILLAGRTNPVLREFLEKFMQDQPEVELVAQQEVNGEFVYVSNKKGLLGKFDSREEYIQLLRASKIAFYTTPGIDGGERRTGGFNPVTPRFLELLSAQCLVVARYPDNADTRFYELNRICPNVDSYAQFEELLLKYLQSVSVPISLYEEIVLRHATSRRAEELQYLLKQFS